MKKKFKIHDIVRYSVFPFENDEFLIVGDKGTSWEKATPFSPNDFLPIEVENDKDFILLRKKGDSYGIEGIPENGLLVKSAEIELIINYS
jgi:hypothetical protein